MYLIVTLRYYSNSVWTMNKNNFINKYFNIRLAGGKYKEKRETLFLFGGELNL